MREATLLRGHVLDVLRSLPAGSIHCGVTSPPYWGLRDYGLAPQAWGGEAACEHEWGAEINGRRQTGGTESSGLGKYDNGLTGETIRTKIEAQAHGGGRSAFCGLCGAWRGSLGLEPTIELYVAHLVAIFEEVRRVLRDDGTLWLNIGDSYAAGKARSDEDCRRGGKRNANAASSLRAPNLKPKDLCLIPFRLAIALQEAGWWVRSDIIWAKPAPMPESVTDRPTRSHEYIFLLTKSARYFYDGDAVREADKGLDHPRSVLQGQPSLEPTGGLLAPHKGLRTTEGRNGAGRNLRSVWTIASTPFPEAHFATFPPELAERCIKAGCPAGGVVLDPFGGAGTTAMVALRLGRSAVSIELKPEYVQMQERRIVGDAPLLNRVTTASPETACES